MSAVLPKILHTGMTCLASGEQVQATGYIDESCGRMIQDVIRDIRPSVCLEVGLAFGISALYILEALSQTGGEKLIGMDPAQHDKQWRGGGLYNIQQAGYAGLYEFHEDNSQRVLPYLTSKNQRVDFAFIDGWHTFDHTLVDFFYIDQMLNPAGVLVFDDVGYPAIRRVCDFVLTNRAYEIYGSVHLPRQKGLRQKSKSEIVKLLDPLVRTDNSPTLEAREKESAISDVYFLALRKLSNDTRPFDHFVHF